MGVLNTTPATWAVGEKVTAAKMTTEINNAMTNLQAGWTAWTVAWSSTGTAVAIGNGVFYAAYNQVGKTITARFSVTAGTTTTFGTGNYQFTLPVTQAAAYSINDCMGTASFKRATGYSGSLIYAGGGKCLVWYGAGATSGVLSQTAPGAWASGDLICSGTYSYEAA